MGLQQRLRRGRRSGQVAPAGACSAYLDIARVSAVEPLSRVTDATVDVLRALRESGRHVWGLQVVKRSGRAPGTVYPVLERLERAGWITSAWESDDARPGPRRRLYEFTPDGARAAVELLAERDARRTPRKRAAPRTHGRLA
ncbi:PadR family transcriptional regulator [Nocardioides sp. SYSU DS0651]|uniref:PadR family transcriptional regulator n=1 Tax=Nocardioides sp. SYSU DS0651 TaxID=3415955 RepID=UPI003F4C2D2B